jgi:hypothetical protein
MTWSVLTGPDTRGHDWSAFYRVADRDFTRAWHDLHRDALIDHDGGDEDRSGSVTCDCRPWCGFQVCPCGDGHGSCPDGDRTGLCRDCHLDKLWGQCVSDRWRP